MSNPSIVHLIPGKAIGVLVSPDYYDFRLEQSEIYNTWVLVYKSPYIYEKYKKECWKWDTQFEEQMIVLGLAKNLTEEDWKKVVEGYIYSGRSSYQAYKDYSARVPQNEEDIITDPKESGLSLLKYLSLDPLTTVILVKQ
jgi:hypothetical protein